MRIWNKIRSELTTNINIVSGSVTKINSSSFESDYSYKLRVPTNMKILLNCKIFSDTYTTIND